jgi:hypothetical protein
MATPAIALVEVPHRSRVVSTGTVATALLALFAADNIVLLAFLGVSWPLVALACAAAAGSITWLSRRILRDLPGVPLSAIAAMIALATVLLVLGGEGRLFFANADWQIRDAVLTDLASQPWPFAYRSGGEAFILRAPIGMYLLPALAGAGPAAEFAMLANNAVRLGLCLALAWPLFGSTRARTIALAVFILFSGWDIVGTVLYYLLGVKTNWDELELWNFGYQYSSHVTLLFWVPQHALAGWLCAVTFLLWRRGMAPLGLFAAVVPMVGLWSPLAVIGAVPFALFAGCLALSRRTLRPGDFALAALAVALSLPALAYMQLDAAAVGAGMRDARPSVYVFCAMFEVLPFIYPLLREREEGHHDRPLLWLILAFLIAVPLFQIGHSADLQMRASIMPLALLAIAFAERTTRLVEGMPDRKTALWIALGTLAIGAVTPLNELRRTLAHPTSPTPLCSLVDVWSQQTGLIVPISTYLARVEAMPDFLVGVPVTIQAGSADRCWARPWPGARPWSEREPVNR